MKCEILVYPDPILQQKAAPIEKITPEIKKLAEDMVETMYEADGIGLAAPQVGQSCRLIVIDITGPSLKEDLKVIINPEIVTSEGEVEYEEGCLSIRELKAKVKRAEKVTVKGKKLNGKPVKIEADGLLAVCLQHEIDHLDGVLFIDRLSRLKRTLYDKKVKKWQKQEQANSA